MEQTILIVYLVVAIALVGIILLQQGKGAEMGASFGAGGANTVFGAAGSGNAMTKATTVLAIIFFATAMSISYINSSPEVVVDQLFIDEKPVEKLDLDAELPMSTDAIESATPATEKTLDSETAPVDSAKDDTTDPEKTIKDQ